MPASSQLTCWLPRWCAGGRVPSYPGGWTEGVLQNGALRLTGADAAAPPAGAKLLLPAMLDIHTHGAMRVDALDADGPGVDTLSRYYRSHMLGGFLAGTAAAPLGRVVRAAEMYSRVYRRQQGGSPLPGARLEGMHIEGPFISKQFPGAQNVGCILPPDPALMGQIIDAADGMPLLFTVAPEAEGGLDAIDYLISRGCRVSAGHTGAGPDCVREAIRRGLRSFTHTFNGMPPIHHRAPGTVTMALGERCAYAELICDGIHIAPEVIKLAYAAKGADGLILVSDSITAAGLPDGDYSLAGDGVIVKDGRATTAANPNTLAGSTTNLLTELRNLARYTSADVGELCKCASRNPASFMGINGYGCPGGDFYLCGAGLEDAQYAGRVEM